MEPTLHSDASRLWKTLVWVEHFRGAEGSAPHAPLKKGQIVTVLGPQTGNMLHIKRIVGLPGDAVAESVEDRIGLKVTIVPKHHVWLEGDNQKNSHDSRSYGAVQQKYIAGLAKWVVWPPGEIKRL